MHALWIALSFAAFLLQLHVSAAAYPQTYPSTVAPTTAATYKPTTAAPHCPQICPAGPVGPKGRTEIMRLRNCMTLHVSIYRFSR